MTASLFEPIRLRELAIPNRVWMAPMCQYSADDAGEAVGAPNDWHLQHYVSRAVGGAGLVMVEATGVSPEGRISPSDLGLWNDVQRRAFARVVERVKEQGAVAGIQLAHAGRKASTAVFWRGEGPLSAEEGGWTPLGPSPVPFAEGHLVPHGLTREELRGVAAEFAASAKLALEAGFEVVEVHGAHGYLLSSFLSPLANRREDEYGGSFENRVRFPLEVVDAVREVWPKRLPVLFRISATDWAGDEGWTPEDTVRFAPLLAAHGVDLLDVSSGGNTAGARIPTGPGYQVPFAARVRRETALPSGAAGLITEPAQAAKILADGEADVVLLGRELLRDPYWPRRAARELGVEVTERPLAPPPQYGRG
ncbi:MAG TPA: NADH:flavin oxidoreductase/NADH oxidase [Glycomyces sp.]|nr:NADH:flavin oxidoreductase/NADH oxidase [Glycomyces sp.]